MAGDTHGDLLSVEEKLVMAKRVGDIQRVVILGDFGLWWGHEAIVFLDELNDMARDYNMQVFALPGNHENHEYWEALTSQAPATAHGWAYVRSNVLLSPKIHQFR